MSADRPHLSIGEVLEVLRDEFPDVTVSKIRFLESQGLVTPERTPSGYRKFQTEDVERLRWILRQQKEHYLPLKIIKGRLGADGIDEESDAELDDGLTPEQRATEQRAPAQTEPDGESATAPKRAPTPSPATPGTGTTAGAGKRTSAKRGTRQTKLPISLDDNPSAEDLRRPLSGASFTRAELAKASGIEELTLKELEGYGLFPKPKQVGEDVFFDEEALEIARLAAGFFDSGLEARHLRMYRQIGEREAALFMQVALPYLKQRNPAARKKAQERVVELARLGRGLRTAMLRQALEGFLDD